MHSAPDESLTTISTAKPPRWAGLHLARQDLALALLTLLFLVLPLYRTPVLEDSFLSPKLLLMQVVCGTVLLALTVRMWRGRSAKRQPLGDAATAHHRTNTRAATHRNNSLVSVLLALFVLVQVRSLFYAPSKAMAVTALVYFTSFLMLHLACGFVVRGPGAVRLLFNCGFAAATVTAGWTLFEDSARGLGWNSIVARLPDWRGYLSAGLGNSGHIAGYMGLFLPWGLLAFLASERFRPSLFAALLLIAAGFVVTWSVGSAGATILSILVWGMVVALSAFRSKVHWKRLLPLLAGTAAVAAFYLLPHPLNPHQPSLWKEAFGSARWAEGWPTRVVIWKTTWHMIVENPWLGIGAGNFTREYVSQVVPGVLADPQLRLYAGAFTNDAHNEFLQVWCEGGLAALLLFLGIFIAWMLLAHRQSRQLQQQQPTNAEGSAHFWLLISAGAGITVFLLDSLMTFPMRLPAHFAAVMFFLAVPGCLAMSSFPATAASSRGRWGMAALLALACLCVTIHFRRVAAEYYLKQARTVVENAPVFYQGHPIGAWQAADYALRAGIHQLAQGNRPAAEAYFTQAQQLTRSDAFNLAEQGFRKSWEWDANYTNSTSRYGQLKLMERSYDTARALLLGTLDHLQASEIWERLGLAEFMLGNNEAAVEAWQTALKRRPLLAEHYQGLIRQARP